MRNAKSEIDYRVAEPLNRH